MKNNGKKLSIAALVFLALYVAIVLILCEGKGSGIFWLSFAFMCVSILAVAAIAFFTSGSFQALRDWIFNIPIIRICMIYLTAELVISLLFMLIPMGWKAPLIIQLIVIVAFFALVTPAIFQRQYVEENHRKTVEKVSFSRVLYAKLTALAPRVSDGELKKVLAQTTDTMRHADPMSHESLSTLEAEIAGLIDALEMQIKSGDVASAKATCTELDCRLAERSQMARAMKLSQY